MVGRRFLLVAFLVIVLPLGAKAGPFLGQTVQATYYDPTTSDINRGPWTAVVGPGVEFTALLPCFNPAGRPRLRKSSGTSSLAWLEALSLGRRSVT